MSEKSDIKKMNFFSFSYIDFFKGGGWWVFYRVRTCFCGWVYEKLGQVGISIII